MWEGFTAFGNKRQYAATYYKYNIDTKGYDEIGLDFYFTFVEGTDVEEVTQILKGHFAASTSLEIEVEEVGFEFNLHGKIYIKESDTERRIIKKRTERYEGKGISTFDFNLGSDKKTILTLS